MTTKPRHTTSKRRHGASLRLEKRNEQAAQVDRDLARAIAAHYGSPIEHKAKPGTWQSVAEHEAKLAIKHAGLIAWAHIETVKPGEQE